MQSSIQMFHHHLFRLQRNYNLYQLNYCRKYVTDSLPAVSRTTKTIANDDEYSKEPNYPEIRDTSFRGKKLHRDRSWSEVIKNLGTVEEKHIKINMPKYYGYKCAIFKDDDFRYNTLPFFKNCTRTSLIETDKLPEFYNRYAEQTDLILNAIKNDIEDAIIFEHTGYDKNKLLKNTEMTVVEKRRYKSSKLINQINRILLNALSTDVPHLNEIEIDLDPRHEAFWFVGGITPPNNVKRYRREIKFRRHTINEPVNRMFQYMGTPMLALRHQLPLEPINEYKEYDLNEIIEKIPKITYDPRSFGYRHEHRHGTNVPGYWPGTENEFGLLSYHSRHHMVDRNPNYGELDNKFALYAQGILCSYGWLFSQACYQGFTTLNDITYPLNTQTIITDGQYWSFNNYQMNTMAMHINAIDTNLKMNQCWATRELKLYEQIDVENGKIIGGLNDDVLRFLIQFYLNKPMQRNYDMKPFLNADEPIAADIYDKDRREFLETRYKHMVANRQRHLLAPEIYHWEKIYKIDHQTRPLDARRRFFELNINPFNRNMNEHTPPYVPKKLRPNGRKDKQKWAKMYYP